MGDRGVALSVLRINVHEWDSGSLLILTRKPCKSILDVLFVICL